MTTAACGAGNFGGIKKSTKSRDSRPGAPSTALWLAPLLVLGIAILAALGLISLREDHRAAERDAEILAQALADSLARECRTTIAMAVVQFTQEMETLRNSALRRAYGMTNEPGGSALASAGEASPGSLAHLPKAQCFVRDPTRFPPPLPMEVPEPPDWMLQVPSGTLAVLEALEPSAPGGNRAAGQAQIESLAVPPDAPWRGVVELQRARLEPNHTEEILSLRRVARDYPSAVTASGVFVGDLALAQAIMAVPSAEGLGELIPEVIARATFHPSFLTERLVAGLETRVQHDFPALADRVALAAALCQQERNTAPILSWWWQEKGHGAGVFGMNPGQGPFLVLSRASAYLETNVTMSAGAGITNSFHGSDFILTIVPGRVIMESVQRVANELASRWPPYLAAEVELAGMQFAATPGAGRDALRSAAQPILARRRDGLGVPLAGSYPFTVNLWLGNADQLYARQRQRVWLFGSVIVAAAGLALAGAWHLQKNLAAQLRLNAQKSNFVSSVSHELRAPIAAVRLMAENLERGKIPDAEKQGEYFRFIGQECRRLSALIENVLDFSRIEQGRKQYEPEPTDLVALVQQTVQLMTPYAAEKGVGLRVECAVPGVEWNVDGRAIQQALVNLIDNAVKHSPKGAVVKVGLAASGRDGGGSAAATGGHWVEGTKGRAPAGAAVLLWVEDQGPGIPAAEHERIFERFYRLGSELRRETQGVGIGLSIVKHIMEAHGGRVRVESAPGRGSRFSLELFRPPEPT